MVINSGVEGIKRRDINKINKLDKSQTHKITSAIGMNGKTVLIKPHSFSHPICLSGHYHNSYASCVYFVIVVTIFLLIGIL